MSPARRRGLLLITAVFLLLAFLLWHFVIRIELAYRWQAGDTYAIEFTLVSEQHRENKKTDGFQPAQEYFSDSIVKSLVLTVTSPIAATLTENSGEAAAAVSLDRLTFICDGMPLFPAQLPGSTFLGKRWIAEYKIVFFKTATLVCRGRVIRKFGQTAVISYLIDETRYTHQIGDVAYDIRIRGSGRGRFHTGRCMFESINLTMNATVTATRDSEPLSQAEIEFRPTLLFKKIR